MNDYQFILYRPEFRAQVLELQMKLWSADEELNAANLRWKYEENPYCETPLIFLALHQGRAVGMRGVYGARWIVGNPPQLLPALCVGDLVIAPKHQGRLLFFPIMSVAFQELARRGCQHLFGMSGIAVTHQLSLLAGFQKVGEYAMLRRDGEAAIAPPVGFQSLDSDPRPQEMADLVMAIGSDGRIRHQRDRTWFAWRFRNPLSEYRFLYAEAGGKLEGYLVLQHSRKRPAEGLRIMEWEMTGDAVGETLLRGAIAASGPVALSIWAATLPRNLLRLLEVHGFVPYTRADGHRPGPLVKALPGANAGLVVAGRNLLDFADWDLRMSFTDSY